MGLNTVGVAVRICASNGERGRVRWLWPWPLRWWLTLTHVLSHQAQVRMDLQGGGRFHVPSLICYYHGTEVRDPLRVKGQMKSPPEECQVVLYLPSCRWHLGLDSLILASPISTLWSCNHLWLCHVPSEVYFPAAVIETVASPWSLYTGQREQVCGEFQRVCRVNISQPPKQASAPGTPAGKSGECVSRAPSGWGPRSSDHLFWTFLFLPVTKCGHHINTHTHPLPSVNIRINRSVWWKQTSVIVHQMQNLGNITSERIMLFVHPSCSPLNSSLFGNLDSLCSHLLLF